MTIKVGDRFPSHTYKVLGDEGAVQRTTDELLAGRRVVLFAVPGAFTPTCSAKHLPGYIEHAEALKKAGIDAIVCLSVNDHFVMRAWSRHAGADGIVEMLPDGSAELTRKLGLEQDFSANGMGIRSRRFAMVIEDGIVRDLRVEPPGQFEVSSAESVLQALTTATV